MMAAQILSRRGRSLGVKYCPQLTSVNIALCPFSTRTYLESEPDPSIDNSSSSGDGPPPRKKHPQSFVQNDIDLKLGELEMDLPRGFHRRGGRGRGQYRHAQDGRDSYWRPPWNSPRAEIISAEDFANRPRVIFGESFLTMHDAMAVLTWMPQKDKDDMYKMYIEMMTAMADQAGDPKRDSWGVLSANTSHEYVVRVIAQEYSVTTSRAAGVIQLQHNEEQLKRDPTFKVNHALQASMDGKMTEYIREVYKSYGEVDPGHFVEEPIAGTGTIGREDGGSIRDASASELTDVDALFKRTRMMELEESKLRIDNHIYVEDIDERTRKVKVDSEANELMKRMEELKVLYGGKAPVEVESKEEGESAKSTADEKTADEGESAEKEKAAASDGKDGETTGEGEVQLRIPKSLKKHLPTKGVPKKQQKVTKPPQEASPYPENNRGHKEAPETRRPRWKYVAQIINTNKIAYPPGSKRGGRKVAARSKGKRHGRVVDGNTIVEEGGKLRVASVAELEQTSWRHVRNESEFMFRGVKDAWLRRQLEEETGGWGVQEEVDEPEKKAESSKKEAADAE